jgi:hypothetical protein
MTQEERELLFKDLSARLPYHVRCKIWLKDGTTEEGLLDLEHNYGNVLQDAFYYNKIKDIKPYLRPMSSMTEEEKREYFSFIGGKRPFDCDFSAYPIEYTFVYEHDINSYIDWLNKHHFDYRGLIEKGLALEAPEGMYKNK